MSNSVLKDWRDVASKCPDILVRKLIRDCADELQAALSIFMTNPTAEWLRVVNGLFVKGNRHVSLATQVPDPMPPTAAVGDATLLAEAA